MFLFVTLSLVTLSLSLVLALVAMNAALLLVQWTKQPSLTLVARELPAVEQQGNVVALRPAAGSTARAA